MNTLLTIAGVLFVAIVIVLIVYGERSITGHWLFWLGIGLVVVTFLGVPAAIISGVNRMNL